MCNIIQKIRKELINSNTPMCFHLLFVKVFLKKYNYNMELEFDGISCNYELDQIDHHYFIDETDDNLEIAMLDILIPRYTYELTRGLKLLTLPPANYDNFLHQKKMEHTNYYNDDLLYEITNAGKFKTTSSIDMRCVNNALIWLKNNI